MNLRKEPTSLLLITIFGVSVTTGLMAQREQQPTGTKIRREIYLRKNLDRKPDSQAPVKTEPAKPAPGAAPEAEREVVVAVIDTGIDFTHPDLESHRWINTKEIAGNGIDDDGNGYVDDVDGYDFAGRQGQVKDTHGHGTHIAGIILKDAPHVRLMNLKYFNRGLDGAAALRNSLEAMRYAIAMHADIINYSGGGTVPSIEELALLTEASRAGILVVAAAGNEASDSQKQPFYPANYNLPNILSVTAIDEAAPGDAILPSSNYGVRSVAVAAQGKDVESTLPGGHYGRMTGTSQATAFVTAAAARLIARAASEGRKTTPEELIERIVVSAKSTDSLKGKTRLGSKLSTTRALAFRDNTENAGVRKERGRLLKALESELSVQAKVSPYGL